MVFLEGDEVAEGDTGTVGSFGEQLGVEVVSEGVLEVTREKRRWVGDEG